MTVADGDFAPDDPRGLCRKMNEKEKSLDRAGTAQRPGHDAAASAYARGLWTDTTLADALRNAAKQTPGRVLVVDGERRIDCRTL